MADLHKLLQQVQISGDSSSDSDSSDDDNVGGLAAGLIAMAAAQAVAQTAGDDPVARALASLVVLKGLEEALSDGAGGIRVGDMVRLDGDENKVRRLQEGHGGWNKDMVKDLGKLGSVVKTAGDDSIVHIGKKTWRLNHQVCNKIGTDEKKSMFSFGDRIYVEFADDIAKQMQRAHGGWNSLMESDLQKIGRVVGTDGDGDIAVQFWTRTWRITAAACKILTVETCCSFKVGDRVFVDNDVDISALKVLQEDHKAWSPNIVDQLGKIGEVVAIDQDGDLEVKLGKRKWFLTPDVCTKITSVRAPGGDFFCVGDTVSIGLPADVFKEMQTDHGEWNDDMAKDVGQHGKVLNILPNGDIYAEFGSKKWRLNPAVLTRHSRERQIPFKVGQRITIDMEPAEFLKLQIGHGGLNTSMLTDIGKVGKILEIYPDRDLMVQFTPNLWMLNPAICTKLSERPKASLNPADRVYIGLDADLVKALQDGHGGFVDTMYRLLGQCGRVLKVMADGNIMVLYGILPMVLNPAIVSPMIPVELEPSAGATVNTSAFSVGDLISIDLDAEMVKKMQVGHGEWSEAMHQILGKVGIVEKVDKDGDLTVCFGNKVATLNPAVCTPVRADAIQDNAAAVTTGTPQTNSQTTPAGTSSGGSDRRCKVCQNRDVSIVFGCGHGACEPCNKRMKDCHVCQAQITYRTNMFF